jgi:RNA-binding protein
MRADENQRFLNHTMDNKTRKRLRQIAHHLEPVVSIGEAGVSDTVIAETQRALDDHELIKIKIHVADRTDRALLGDALVEQCGAIVVQKIGKVLVLFRQNPQPKPHLSNLTRN